MSRQPSLKQLRYLCGLAEHRHFGRAAEACHVSQSTLSAGLQALENTLGVALVERGPGKVLLTPAGEETLRRSRDILTAVEDLMAVTETARTPFSGRMRMGVIPTIAPFLLPRLLKRLRQTHPQFQLFIREEMSRPLVEALVQGELDVLLLALPFPGEAVTTRHLFYDDFLLAFQNDHPIRERANLRTRDLKGQDMLLLEEGHCLRDHAMEACKLRDSDIHVPYHATSLNTIVQMVANGIGITVLPRIAVAARILAGTDVSTRPFEEEKVRRSIGLMWRKSSPRAAEFEQLGEFIQHTAGRASAES